jgi:hypothetical protein
MTTDSFLGQHATTMLEGSYVCPHLPIPKISSGGEQIPSSDASENVQEQAVRLAGWAEAITSSVVNLYLQGPTSNCSYWQRFTPAESGRLGSTTVTLL